MEFFGRNNYREEVIRVNHAGEYAAVNIYKAQAFVLKFREKKLYSITKEMLEHEKIHYDFFDKKIAEYNVRPTFFLPAWKALSFGLGFVTGILGKNTTATCTVAVEEVIENHYDDQLKHKNDFNCPQLQNAIEQFLEDERCHKNLAQKEYVIIRPLADIIKIGCKIAIFLSKRF